MTWSTVSRVLTPIRPGRSQPAMRCPWTQVIVWPVA